MKRSDKVTLVLITAALASCNRYLNPADPSLALSREPVMADSCALAESFPEPGNYTWPGAYVEQWFYAFNPFAGSYNLYAPYFSTHINKAQWRRLSRPVRRGVVRGGWGRSAHSVHS